MKKLLPICICIMFFSCVKKGKVKSDWVNQNLKGRVKSITDSVYQAIGKSGIPEKNSLQYIDSITYNNSGFLLREISRSHDTITFQRICKYDSHYNLIEKVIYYKARLLSHQINRYDDRNSLVDQIIYKTGVEPPTDSLVKFHIHYTYKYDRKGNVTELIDTMDGTLRLIVTNILNEKGNVIKQKRYSSGAHTSNDSSVFQYDMNGNQLEHDDFDANGQPSFKFMTKYDSKGNEIEETIYRHGDTIELKEVKAYDDKGNMIQEIDSSGDGRINRNRRYEFKKFDKMGNWIEQVFYNKDNPETITERSLEYY